jgi:hypothetical protein
MTDHSDQAGAATPEDRTWLPGAVAFAAFAGSALAILAAVVLLPAYAQLQQSEYELACLRTDVAHGEAWIAANERLIADLPGDAVVTRRLARSQLRWLPNDELVAVRDESHPPQPLELVSVPDQPRPAPPAGMLFSLASAVEPRSARLFLLACAAALMFAGMLVGGGSWRKVRRG